VGTLSLPKTGRVYVDAAPVIYTRREEEAWELPALVRQKTPDLIQPGSSLQD